MKKISCLLSLLLMLAPIANVLGQSEKNVDQIKKSVARLGVGSKARATIILHDGKKVKGYVYSTADDDFVIRDRKTDAPTTIPYANVYKVEDKRDDKTGMFLGIGLAATLALLVGGIVGAV